RRHAARGVAIARRAGAGRHVSPLACELCRAREAACGAARVQRHHRRAVAAGSRSRAGVPAHHGAASLACQTKTQVIPAFGSGCLTLLYKELLRFWKVSFQTILAPVLTALLYLLIFSHVLES